MKMLPLLCALTVLSAQALRAQTLSPAEVNKAVQYLEKTRSGVIKATQGLSPAQWNFKPATNRWSVAEVTEHIAAAEDLFMAMIRGKVMKAPGRTEAVDIKAL